MAITTQQLRQLLLNNSLEVPTLRTRAISGNKEILSTFVSVAKDMAKRGDHASIAYKQINQLLISARPEIAKQVNENIMEDIVQTHQQNNKNENGNLDYYIILWKKMMDSNNANYPNLSSRLKSIQLPSSKNIELPQQFQNNYRQFTKNQSSIFDQRIQFFPDSKTSFGNSSSSHNDNSSDHVIQQLAEGDYGTIQASSEQIEVDMKEIQQLKGQIQSGNADINSIGNYVRKVKQFLRMKPKSLRKQLSLDYNNDRIWAKEFLDNVKSDSYKNSLQLNRNTLQPTIRNSNLLSVERAIANQKPFQSISIPYQVNQSTMPVFPSMKKSNMNQFSPPNTNTNANNNATTSFNPSTQRTPPSPSFATFPMSPNRGSPSPFTTSYVQPSQPHQPGMISSSVQVVTPHYNNNNNTNTNNNPASNFANNVHPINGESVSFKKQHGGSNRDFELQAYQSQTMPYNYSQFQNKNSHSGNDNPNMFILPNSQTNVNGNQGINNNNNRMLINSKSADNLYSPASERSRPRPRIFGNNNNTAKLSQPNEQNLQIINHGRNNSFITTYKPTTMNNQHNSNSNRHSGYQNMLNNQPVMQIGNFSSHQATFDRGIQQYQNQTNFTNQLNGISNAQSAIFNNNQIYTQAGLDFKSQKQIDNNGIMAVPYNPASGRWTFVSDRTPTAFSSEHQKSPIYRGQIYTPRTQAQIYDNWSNNKINNNIYAIQSNQNSNSNNRSHNNNSNNGLVKLSQFSNEKTKRKMEVAKNELSSLENYLIKPYTRNFDDMANFNRFRSTCLNDSFTLYSSPQLLIYGQVVRLSSSKIRIYLTYENKTISPLQIQTLYRIPKCMQVHKNTKISKNWRLSSNNNPAKHNFELELNSFPLQPCFLNLKYALDYPYSNNNINTNANNSNAVILSLSITITNYIGYLITNQYQWIANWQAWTQSNNFHRSRHIVLEKQVLSNDIPQLTLKQFINLPPVSNYSVQQHGALCQHTQNILYLIRISHRVDNIVSIQIVANTANLSGDQSQFLEYILGVWAMLLAKVDKSQLG